MGRRARQRPAQPAAVASETVGPRQPCPCGSGRRYKNCHGRAGAAPAPFVARTFAGLPGECDWVALREIVPAGTTSVRLTGDHAGRDVRVCSLLPAAAPALVRSDGAVWLGLQALHSSGDVSRELATALRQALVAEPGTQVSLGGVPPDAPRLQDLVEPDGELDVQVHDGYDFWLVGLDEPPADLAAALQAANEAVAPTRRLDSVGAAYWTLMSGREYLRWVLPYEEEVALDALARLHAAGDDTLLEGSRLIGSFRAHGLVVPVWEVPTGTGADALQSPAEAVGSALRRTVELAAPLTAAERSARAGLTNRQVTLR